MTDAAFSGRSTVFLDLDGVIVDNGPSLHEAYVRAVSEGLHERMGGSLQAWREAHETAYRNAPSSPKGLTPEEAYRWEDVMGVRGPCQVLGVEPPSEEECAVLGDQMNRLVRLKYASFLPDADAAVRELGARYTLHMSSGNAGWVIEAVLERLGVREQIGMPFGADLAGALKREEDFYPRVFDLAGVDPKDAVVVDDSPQALARAGALGAATVLVDRHGHETGWGIDLVIGGLAELPRVLRASGGGR